ncbi:MAG: hypothetical protein M0Q51_02850 [Bacteroidales bacterium]|nr:hypothetical protein [Bacteroidales bacterium]
MKNTKLLLGLLLTELVLNSCAPVKTTVTFKNYNEADVTVNIESYTKKGSLKVNESVSVGKGIKDQTTKQITPTNKIYVTNGYKGGNIKMKYHPTISSTSYTIEPIIIPDSKNDVYREEPLTGLVMYDATDGKLRLKQLGTDLKFDSTSTLSRLVDIRPLLGCLIIGKEVDEKLIIQDYIQLEKFEITFDKPSIIQETAVTEKSIVSGLKISVPIYGSVEANMSSSNLCMVKCDILWFSYTNTVSTATLITSLDDANRKVLIAKLKLQPSDQNIYILRSFNVIESGIFSTTNGTNITSGGNAAIASVFTANASYAFKSEDSKFYSIPNQAYNLYYQPWQTVSSLLLILENNEKLPLDGDEKFNIMIPEFEMK